MSMSLRVIVPPHPLISHWLTILRNPTTPEILYATGLEQLGTWLTYEALRDWIPSKKEQITTSTGTTECSVIDPNIPILAIPYLPAGLELYRGARDLIPNSNLCIGGLPTEIEENAGIIFQRLLLNMPTVVSLSIIPKLIFQRFSLTRNRWWRFQ